MKKYKRLVAKVYEPTENVHGEAAEEPKYVISPKGCAMLAFADSGIEIDEGSFNYFWNEFEKHLDEVGYTIV